MLKLKLGVPIVLLLILEIETVPLSLEQLVIHHAPPIKLASTSATSSGLSCKNIISDNRAQIAKLEFHPPTRKKDKFITVPSPEALVEGRTHFENCLVGYFLAANASFSSVSGVEEKLWDKVNLLDVTTTVDGFFFFRFSNVAKMVEVIMEVGV